MAFLKKMYFRAQTAAVLEQRFNYRYGEMDIMIRQAFNAICDQISHTGGNEFDAAVFFMLLLRKQLSDSSNVKYYKDKWLSVALDVSAYANLLDTRQLVEREREEER